MPRNLPAGLVPMPRSLQGRGGRGGGRGASEHGTGPTSDCSAPLKCLASGSSEPGCLRPSGQSWAACGEARARPRRGRHALKAALQLACTHGRSAPTTLLLQGPRSALRSRALSSRRGTGQGPGALPPGWEVIALIRQSIQQSTHAGDEAATAAGAGESVRGAAQEEGGSFRPGSCRPRRGSPRGHWLPS